MYSRARSDLTGSIIEPSYEGNHRRIVEAREELAQACPNNPLRRGFWGLQEQVARWFSTVVTHRQQAAVLPQPSPAELQTDGTACFDQRHAVAAEVFAEWFPGHDRLLPTWQGSWVRLRAAG